MRKAEVPDSEERSGEEAPENAIQMPQSHHGL